MSNKKYCSVCADWAQQPCTDPDCPITDDSDELDGSEQEVAELDFDSAGQLNYYDYAEPPEEELL